LRLVFLGTPRFAVPSLEQIVEAGHEVAAVITQPDRPSGRGRRVLFSPVKEAARRLGIEVHQPERIRRPEVVDWLRSLGARAMAIVGYGQIIPQSIIDLAPLGIINVHASLLPKYRGAAPIQWAIANGESITGVTTMRIDAGLDTGDILLARSCPILPGETAVELSERLAPLGGDLLVETFAGLEPGTVTPVPQDHTAATLAPILKKEDGLIDWNSAAAAIVNRIHGFQPWPGAYTFFRGLRLHLWRAVVGSERHGSPGSVHVFKRRMLVAAGEGSVEPIEVQVEGRKKIPAEAFLNGFRVDDNEILGEQLN
jgi:methionyl-tRNA formyltransferase